PSLHGVPLVAVGLEQTPVVGSQVPGTWHWSEAVQTFGVPPQVPLVQTSPVVQALPSLHVVPSGCTRCRQPVPLGSLVSGTQPGCPVQLSQKRSTTQALVLVAQTVPVAG